MKKILPLFLLLIIPGCSDDNPSSPEPTGNIEIIVRSEIDSSAVSPANIVLFNANNGESVIRAFNGANGLVRFDNLPVGNYYVKISAQGYKPSPQGNITPVPFSIAGGQTNSRIYYLDTLAGVFGTIEGTVSPALRDVLVTAVSQSGSEVYGTYSGPDGYYKIYNVSYDTYNISAVKAGYYTPASVQTAVNPTAPSVTVNLIINETQGASLTGKVTFLAANNGIVDISLLNSKSSSVVNGLTTIIDSARNYSIQSIPAGEYLAWASYKNDGYVMDPDWIFKNPGVLNLHITGSNNVILDFSVTDAITLISPTNPMNEVIPVMADSAIPLFSWTAYPSTKEYIIEVRDINGKLIWGGFNDAGIIRHSAIPKETTSIRFNFDGSASSGLVSGNIYQWKIYADDDAAPDVQTLLSASEDLMGLFYVP